MDINETIIAEDAVQGQGLSAIIPSISAEFTEAKWDGKNKQSYYAYITDQLAKQHPQLSRADETFKNKRSELLKEFPTHLKQHHPRLLVRYEQEKAQMLKVLSGKGMVIFPSFYKTIHWLNHHYPNKYTLYLRSFGEDFTRNSSSH